MGIYLTKRYFIRRPLVQVVLVHVGLEIRDYDLCAITNYLLSCLGLLLCTLYGFLFGQAYLSVIRI